MDQNIIFQSSEQNTSIPRKAEGSSSLTRNKLRIGLMDYGSAAED